MKYPDLTGYKCGKLTVVSKGHSFAAGRYWKCKCECGNVRFYTRQNILKGTLRSCGCFKANCKGKFHKNWKGRGDIGAAVVTKIKVQALRRHIKFSVSMDYLSKLFELQKSCCKLSGLPIHMPSSSYDIGHGGGTASLDRIDSSKGYVVGNVQWVHKDINMMKQEFSQSHFIDLCRIIAKNNE